jgi:DNA-binding MarR family transcriptional regulator
VDEFSVAIGQFVRRVRLEGNPDELNLSQMGALARLDEKGPMTTADLARAEAMKPQSMGTILCSLEQEGLVRRRPHPTDGRQILVELTAKGADQWRQRGIAKRNWMMSSMAKLEPREQQRLMAAIPLLKRLSES